MLEHIVLGEEAPGLGSEVAGAAAASDRHVLAAEVLPSLFESWSQAARAGAAILIGAARERRHTNLGRGHPYEMLLLATGVSADDTTQATAVFVHWESTADMAGKPCRVHVQGGRHYIVYPVPAVVPLQSFAAAAVLHPAIGSSLT